MALVTQFQRRSPIITSVSLDWIQITSTQLTTVLRNSPSIQTLVLHLGRFTYNIDGSFLDALRYRDSDSSPLAPSLDVVWLSIPRNLFSESCLEQMILSRWWTEEELDLIPSDHRPRVKRWRLIHLHVEGTSDTAHQPFSDSFRARMEDLRLHGLDLTLK